jgi:hypothetical protein
MSDDERLEILQRLERGEITAAQAEELLEAWEEGTERELGEVQEEGEAFSDITQWSPEGALTALQLDSFVGRITARAGTPTLVVATVRARARDAGEAKKLLEKVDLQFEEKDHRAHVKADFAKSIFDLFRGAKVSVDFDVTLPAEAAFTANYGTGPLTTEGITSVRANLGNGNVTTDAARADVNIGNGKIVSRGGRELAVNGGNVKVLAEAAEALEKFSYNAGNGLVELKAEALAETANYKMHFGNGKVVAAWARPPENCLIEVTALASKLESDLPFNKEGSTMVYARGEPRARIEIDAAHCKVHVTTEEEPK